MTGGPAASSTAVRPLSILFTLEPSPVRDTYFPRHVLQALESLGSVRYHDGRRPLTPSQLRTLLPGVDVCVTHWGCPRFTEDVLQGADRLALIAHAAGSVAGLVSDAVYARGILVSTANRIMARHVAEGVLGFILDGLHETPQRHDIMRDGGWLSPPERRSAGLRGSTVGLVGCGSVARYLIELLRPFGVTILVYDPFVADQEIAALPGAEASTLEALLSTADIVSLHAALTTSSRSMLGADQLRLIKDGALLVNTARAGLIDEAALLTELRTNRFRAVLDVFHEEPLQPASELRRLPNVLTFPHSAGSSSGPDLAEYTVAEVGRFAAGSSPTGLVPGDQFQRL